MGSLAVDIACRYAGLVRSALRPPPHGCARGTLRHYATTLPLLALLPLWLAYHWLGLLLDEILFRGYRRIAVREPLFILGVPRSGTTAVHHAVAHDPAYTTLTTWECLFAPAISWRYLWRGVGAVDRCLGRPLDRLRSLVERRLLGDFQRIHTVGLNTPEEDYLALLPVLGCFILVVPFPDAAAVWRLGGGARTLRPGEHDRLLTFYHRILQRHLYCQGAGQRLLSKNAAFAGLAPSLARAYPDARILACLREPVGAVSSQLSSMEPALHSLHGAGRFKVFRQRMIDQFEDDYSDLLHGLRRLGTQAVFLPAAALRADAAGTLARAYRQLGLPFPAAVAEVLQAQAAAQPAGGGHRHAPADFGLDAERLRERFAPILDAFDFRAAGPVPAGAVTPAKTVGAAA